ncbi:DUF434 domain-containing protein [Thermococcus sp.]
MRRSSELLEAYRDLKYLLNRGYRKRVALDFVANHYRLTLKRRHFLARCVFSDAEIAERRKKLVDANFLRGRVLGVDGFNVLITLESLIEGRAILCEDGLVRDLKYQKGYRISESTGSRIEMLASFLSKLKPEEVVFFYERAVSRSGEIARLTEDVLLRYGVRGKALAVKSPDFELRNFDTVATSDVGIISKVSHVFDLPHAVGASLGMRFPDFREILTGASLDKF